MMNDVCMIRRITKGLLKDLLHADHRAKTITKTFVFDKILSQSGIERKPFNDGFIKRSSICFIIITSVRNVRLEGGGGGWSGGGPRPMYAFSKIKNDNKLFQQNHHFNAFLIVCFLGEGGGLQKEYVLYAREGDKENGRPPKGNSYIYIWPSLFGSTLK